MLHGMQTLKQRSLRGETIIELIGVEETSMEAGGEGEDGEGEREGGGLEETVEVEGRGGEGGEDVGEETIKARVEQAGEDVGEAESRVKGTGEEDGEGEGEVEIKARGRGGGGGEDEEGETNSKEREGEGEDGTGAESKVKGKGGGGEAADMGKEGDGRLAEATVVGASHRVADWKNEEEDSEGGDTEAVEARGEVLEEIMLVGEEAMAGVGMMAAGATEAVRNVVKDEEMAGEAAGADSEEVTVAEVAVKAEVVEAAEELTGDPGIKSRLRIRWVYSLQRRVLSSLVKIIESKHRMDALLYD